MNFESLKLGFKEYLLKNRDLYDENTNLERQDVSIFMHTDEFRNYLSDELNLDTSLFSASLEDIMSLEIVDGKVVDPNAPDEYDDAQDVDASLSFNIAEDGSIVVSEDESMVLSPDAAADGAMITNENLSDKGLMVDVLNDLLADDEFSQMLDTDGSGDVNTEELHGFFEAIKGNDQNEADISLNDIAGATQEIKAGEFKIETPEEEPEVEEAEETQQAAAAQSTGSAGGGGYGSYGGGGVSNMSAAQNAQPQEKTLDNMTEPELQAELQEATSARDEQTALAKSIADDSAPELQEMKKQIDEAYDDYLEAVEDVDEDLAKELDDKKTEIDEKQTEINEKDVEIIDQKQAVSDAENEHNNAVSEKQNLESIRDGLKASLGSAKEEDKANIQAKLNEVEAKVSAAEKKVSEAKEKMDKAKEKLEELEEQKSDLEKELDTLNEEMSEVEEKILEKEPKLQEMMDKYHEMQESYNTGKQEALDKCNAELEKSQARVAEVQTALQNCKNKQDVKEYGFGAFGENLLEFAKQFIGANEGDGSANVFLNGSSASATPWCAAFVEYVLENGGSYDDVADWYKGIDNKWYCPNVYNAAQSAGAVIGADQAEKGDIVLFDWDGDGVKDHIGIVDVSENGQLVTIEGNTSNQVAQRTYDINDPRLTFCKTTK